MLVFAETIHSSNSHISHYHATLFFVTIPQAGVSVRSDLTHLCDSYGVKGTGAVDVGQLAGRHLGIKVGARSLKALIATLLHRLLPKGGVRTSNWETVLTDEQVQHSFPVTCVRSLWFLSFLFLFSASVPTLFSL